MTRAAIIVAALLTFAALGAGFALGSTRPWEATIETFDAEASESDSPAGVVVTGAVVLDGAVNGCGGEEILVQVRAGAEIVGHDVARSAVEGFDCVFRFHVSAPKMKCYQLFVGGQPVGLYPADSAEGEFTIGYVDSDAVWGDPETTGSPPLNADWSASEDWCSA